MVAASRAPRPCAAASDMEVGPWQRFVRRIDLELRRVALGAIPVRAGEAGVDGVAVEPQIVVGVAALSQDLLALGEGTVAPVRVIGGERGDAAQAGSDETRAGVFADRHRLGQHRPRRGRVAGKQQAARLLRHEIGAEAAVAEGVGDRQRVAQRSLGGLPIAVIVEEFADQVEGIKLRPQIADAPRHVGGGDNLGPRFFERVHVATGRGGDEGVGDLDGAQAAGAA